MHIGLLLISAGIFIRLVQVNMLVLNISVYDSQSNNFLALQGGMSNELYNTIARVTDGIYEGSHIFLLLFCFMLIAAFTHSDLGCNTILVFVLELL